MMGELALRYPAGSLLVSTGRSEGADASDRRFPQPIDRVGIRASRLRTLNGLALWTARAASLARRHRPGVVWCAELKPAGYPARWLASRHAIPVGLFVHGTELLLLEAKADASPFKRATARMLCQRVAAVVANSSWTADLARRVLQRLGLDDVAGRVRAVPLGTEPAHFRPGVDTTVVRRRYALDGGPWLLTVARLEWHKGIDTVIRALPHIRARHPGVRYAVAGEGERRPELERLANAAGMGDAVRFLGAVSDDELPALYNAADMYLGVSRRHELLAEGFGISLVEAAACGLAVVGGRSAGVPDAVRDGATGVLVDPDDPSAVAAAAVALLADPARRRALGAAGRRAVETYFNWDRVIRDIRAIEDEIRSPFPPRASAPRLPAAR
jgi:phosphatidylinositol alpha-1,6-mannosyltransferase